MQIYSLPNNIFIVEDKLASNIEFIHNTSNEEDYLLIHICKRFIESKDNGTYFYGGGVAFDYTTKQCYYCSRCKMEFEMDEFSKYHTGWEGHA